MDKRDKTTSYGPILAGMGDQEARELCGQLRQELIRDVARTGGHLSSNLGVVELSVALHRAFYETRPGTGAVAHLHSTHAVALSTH